MSLQSGSARTFGGEPADSGSVFDFAQLDALAEQRKGEFAAADPFPHLVIDDFLPNEIATQVLAEFPTPGDGWIHYSHFNERKLGLTDIERMGPTTRSVFDALWSDRFTGFLEKLTGIRDLITDPDLDGGGLHQSLPGGFLNIHTDFLAHNRHRHWSRQINLLIYLNKEWQPEWNGNLDLWDAQMKRHVASVEPVFNRCVIFHTQRRSFHGHPHRLCCPEGESRKSLILYYYRDEDEALRMEPTFYQPLPDDPPYKKALVWADGELIRVYSFLKRYAGLRDGIVNRFLKKF